MPQSFRLYRRSNGTYYLEDGVTRKQTSLHTKSKSVATQRLAAHTQAAEQPYLNLTIAKAYLAAKSPEMLSRTWGEIMDDMAISYQGSTRQRWGHGHRQRAISPAGYPRRCEICPWCFKFFVGPKRSMKSTVSAPFIANKSSKVIRALLPIKTPRHSNKDDPSDIQEKFVLRVNMPVELTGNQSFSSQIETIC